MKNFLTVLLIVLVASDFPCDIFARERKVSQGRIENLVSSLKNDAARAGSSEEDESLSLPGIRIMSKGGVEMVSIGRFWTRTIGRYALSDGDEDVRAVAGMMKSLRKLLIVSYEDCEKSVKDNFDRKISKTLDGCELLVQVKDDEDSMSIYGNTSKDGKSIDDIVLFSPQNSTLICFFGTLDADKLGNLVSEATKN